MSLSKKQKRQEEIEKIYNTKVEGQVAPESEIPEPGVEVIAGVDDRRDYYTLNDSDAADALQKQLVYSTVILTDKSDLTEQPDGTYVLSVDAFERGGLKACGGERFGNQFTGGWCSGFMVGSDVIVTAGHCGETDAKIQDTAYVFGFRVASEDDPGTTVFSAEQVYFGEKLIAHDLSPTGDYAVVRVDRKITAPGAVPLSVRRTGAIPVGENIGVIGYPSGLPVKIAYGDNTKVRRESGPWLFGNLDTYGGNSGSAVFNKDGQVEGILVRGVRDYVTDPTGSCFKSNRIHDEDGDEAVTKASVWVDAIPDDSE